MVKKSISLPNGIDGLIRQYAERRKVSYSRAIQEIVIAYAGTFEDLEWIPPQEGGFENVSESTE